MRHITMMHQDMAMVAAELLNNIVPALALSDTGEYALATMQANHVSHLPVVDQRYMIGIVSDEQILSHKLEEPLSTYELSVTQCYVHMHEHIFNIMAKLAERDCSLIAVLDDASQYMGYILSRDLLNYFAKNYAFAEAGGILVIETDKSNYMLSEIARIIEQENAVILSNYVTTSPSSSRVWVTIKVNKTDLQYIKASLERYDYQVSTYYQDQKVDETLQENYDALMKYLSI